MALAIDNLTVTRGPRMILDGVSLTVSPGEVVAVLGPNGAGKSTLLRAALGLLSDQPATHVTGTIRLGDAPLASLSLAERARRAAYMPQERDIAWAVDVRSLVALGRLPHRPAFAAPTRADQDAIDRALTETDTQLLSHRPAPELSGGERARVLIARALAQEAPLLVADEPTSGLDPAQQLALLTLFRRMAKAGAAIILSMHDLQLAARFADRICLLNAGRSTALGPPRDVLTRANIQAVYGCDTLIIETPAGLSFVPMLPNEGS